MTDNSKMLMVTACLLGIIIGLLIADIILTVIGG